VTGGLLTLAAVTTLGTIVPALLLKTGDAWSSWILQASTGGQFSQRLTSVLVLGGGAAPAVVLIFGILAIILSLVQAVLMLFRQAALVILAGVLPLAAAGSMAPLTRPWIRKITSWMLALICYKPAATAVYATAFTMIGTGKNPRTVLMGFVMLLLSVVALPVLMRFFTWTTGAIAGTGGGGQLLGAAAVGAIAVGTMRPGPGGGGGAAAQDQAAYLSTRLGQPAGGSPAGGTPPGGPGNPPGPPPSQPAPPGTSPRSPTGSPASAGGGLADGASTSTPAGASASAATTPNPAARTAAATSGTTGAAPAAGPTGATAAAAAQAAAAAARQAQQAMQPEDTP